MDKWVRKEVKVTVLWVSYQTYGTKEAGMVRKMPE
jgi:hypothetical protein